MIVTTSLPGANIISQATEVAEIPESHKDLIAGPYWAALTTVMPDGQLQTTPVWCNLEGRYVLTNTMLGFRKEKNMRANPRVALLVYDPLDPLRNIEIRGLAVEMTEAGAIEHDDRLAQLYMGKADAHFFGDAVPADLAQTYVPVKVTIAPIHVRTEEPVPSASSKPVPSGCPSEAERANRAPITIHSTLSTPVPLPASVPVPESHLDLLIRPIHGVLSTMKFDGSMPEWSEEQSLPQSSLVWVDYDGSNVLINTTLERQKCRNMQANPRATLLVVDPANTARWIQVRGYVVEITEAGAIAHADKLTQRYTGKQRFYGDVYPAERQQQETRVIVKIEPVKIAVDAIFM